MSDLLDHALPAVVGAFELERTKTGVVPRRIPAWAGRQVVDAAVHTVAAMPAGVRFELLTDATWLELECQLTIIEASDGSLPPAVFDLVIDGEVTGSVGTLEGIHAVVNAERTAYELRPGGPVTVRFELPGRSGTRVEVWLPHTALLELRALRISPGAALEAAPADRPAWVHYGSSISHCQEAAHPTGMWPATVALRAGVSLHSMGYSGQAHLDQWAARAIRDLRVAAVSLKVGINVLNGDSMRDRAFVPAVHGFLDTVRDGHPETPLVLVTPVLCPSLEEHPGPTVDDAQGRATTLPRPPALAGGALTLQRVRERLAGVVEARQDPHLHLVSGLDLFGAQDLVHLPDLLHPDQEGYDLIAQRFGRLVFEGNGPFAHLARLPA